MGGRRGVRTPARRRGPPWGRAAAGPGAGATPPVTAPERTEPAVAQAGRVEGNPVACCLSLSLTCARVAAVLRGRLEDVRRRIEQACAHCGRPPQSVTLIGVTKGIPAEVVREAVAFGVTDLGENRVQEARAKQTALGSGLGARWHLIGHLQRNKVKLAVELFDAIHSVDSAELIADLERHAAAANKIIEVFIQVNVSGEATKFGCRPEEATALAQRIQTLTRLRLVGLMTIAPYTDNPEEARPVFRQLRELRDRLVSTFHLPPSTFRLSMGMSHDFEVAIEELADVIRVGTAIFGAR